MKGISIGYLIVRLRREEIRIEIYAWVSSYLEGQINYLINYVTAKGYRVVEELKDIISGLNT